MADAESTANSISTSERPDSDASMASAAYLLGDMLRNYVAK